MPEPTNAADAVTAALASMGAISDPPETEEVVETPEPEGEAPTEEVVETPEGEEPAAEGEEPAAEGEETDEQKAEREAAEAAENEGKTPEEIAAAKAAKEPPPKKEKTLDDHVNDPIPQQLKAETQERIRTLATSVRELKPLAQQGTEIINLVKDSGMDAAQFGQSLNYARAIRSDKLEDQEQAWDFLLAELKALAPRVGKTLPGMSPLEGHKDLLDGVAAKTITPELAAETAAHRNRTAAATKLQGTAKQAHDTAAQNEQARTAALADLNTLGKTLHDADPKTYKAKYDIIVPIMKKAFKRLHPSEWTAAFQEAWDDLKVAAPAAAAARPAVGAQPLRANRQPSGGAAKQPTTMAEVITASLKGGK